MPDPIIVQKKPYLVKLEAAKNYAWCACGRSKNQPHCDGSHKDTSFTPVKFDAAETRDAWLCGCKHTKDQPYCDGSHAKL